MRNSFHILSLAATSLLTLLCACGDSDAPADGVDVADDVGADGADDTASVGDAEASGRDANGDSDGSADAADADVSASDVRDEAFADVIDVELPRTVGGDRPAKVVFPRSYDSSQSYPLIVLLHGFGASGDAQDIFLGLSRRVNAYNFILVVPDGTTNADGDRFWNATETCCAFGDSDVDDVGYITGLVEEVSTHYNVDSGRVYTFGHSNGGFMSYRLACDASETFTAIVSLAGATVTDPADCTPSGPAVSALQIHGTADGTVEYEGGTLWQIGEYPGAVETIEFHAALAGCDVGAAVDGDVIEVDSSIDGAETTTRSYTEGCPAGVDFALWTITDGGHIPPINLDGTPAALEWLLRHDRTP